MSKQAYHELKEEGKITERQDFAYRKVREFYEEKGYWPTPKEVHTFLALEQAHAIAQFEGPNYVKPRISELVVDPEDDDPDLLEKQEARKQEYIEEKLNSRGHEDYEAKSANPVKIKGYQSTLSEEEGEAAEIEKRKDDPAEPSPGQREDEIEIPYSVAGGDEVRMGPPEEAIQETSDLESVRQLLEEKGLLDEYRDLLSQHGDFVFDPEEGEDESDSDSEENQEILIKDGEPVV